jgi:hypothetical protein
MAKEFQDFQVKNENQLYPENGFKIETRRTKTNTFENLIGSVYLITIP